MSSKKDLKYREETNLENKGKSKTFPGSYSKVIVKPKSPGFYSMKGEPK